jgi:Mrp family chromosome partitioning ATPase
MLLVLLAIAVAIAVAIIYVAQAPRRYEAHAQLLVRTGPGPQLGLTGLNLLGSSAQPDRAVQTVSLLAMTTRVANYASVELGGHPPASVIKSDIVALPVANADAVDIAATASSPANAAATANAVAAGVLTARARDLYPKLDRLIASLRERSRHAGQHGTDAFALSTQLQAAESLRVTGDPAVHLLARAVRPSSASWPNPLIIIGGAGLAGLLVGLLGAFAVESYRPLLRSEAQLPSRFPGPLVAQIPRVKWRARRRGPIAPQHLSAGAADEVRTLSYRLAGSHGVLVTGASPREGRTTLSLALAHAAALSGRETILLEADFRTGTLARTLALPEHAGMRSMLGDPAGLDDALMTLPGFPSRLRVLPAGDAPTTLADLPQTGQLTELIRCACDLADLVIVDAPPLGSFGDAVPLVAVTDFTLLVVRVDGTRLDDLAQAAAELNGAASAMVVIGGHAVKADRRAKRSAALLPSAASPLRV